MEGDVAALQATWSQLQAMIKASARHTPPDYAKDGEWLYGYVDYVMHPGNYMTPIGPKMWTPRYLVHASLARGLA